MNKFCCNGHEQTPENIYICKSGRSCRACNRDAGNRYLDRKNGGPRRKFHGYNKTPTHRSWLGMIQRCTNPNSTSYRFYGALGITVCDRWRDFSAFLADAGERPSLEYSIDRWPNKYGNYEPGNVRWATDIEQANNRRPPAKRAKRTHCSKGHILTPDNVYETKTGSRIGRRICKTCETERRETRKEKRNELKS